MFDLFGLGPSMQQIQESHIYHATNHMALVLLLVDKGIVTDDELNRARTQATQIIDQIVAHQKEEAQKEFDEQYPGVREFVSRIFGSPESP